MKKTILFLFILTGAHVHGQGEVRQRSTTKGINAAAQAHVLGWASTYFLYLDKNAPSGFGGGLWIGYGVTELIEPYISYNFTGMGTSKIDAQGFKMSHFDAGVRVNLAGTVHPVRPYLQAGYTYLKGTVDQVINGGTYDDVEFYGGKPHLGGGLRYFLKIPVAVFADGIFTVGKKSKTKLNGSEIPDKPDVTTFRINIGISLNLAGFAEK
jgi:hypothetical protein